MREDTEVVLRRPLPEHQGADATVGSLCLVCGYHWTEPTNLHWIIARAIDFDSDDKSTGWPGLYVCPDCLDEMGGIDRAIERLRELRGRGGTNEEGDGGPGGGDTAPGGLPERPPEGLSGPPGGGEGAG